MKVKPLSPKEQIDLLIEIKDYINISSVKFICNAYLVLFKLTGSRYKNRELHDLVPLFTFENSKMFGGHKDKSGGWFGLYEVTKRVKFLNWIIEENKKLINQS